MPKSSIFIVIFDLPGQTASYHDQPTPDDRVTTVCWRGDHCKEVRWLPRYLEMWRQSIEAAACPGVSEGFLILGLSQGHCALMACCECRPGGLHVCSAQQYRHFIAAGGSIWQDYTTFDASLAHRILRGMADMAHAQGRDRIPFFSDPLSPAYANTCLFMPLRCVCLGLHPWTMRIRGLIFSPQTMCCPQKWSRAL